MDSTILKSNNTLSVPACQCGECEDKTFKCANCERNVPWCYGADDVWRPFCDDCKVSFGTRLFHVHPKLYISTKLPGLYEALFDKSIGIFTEFDQYNRFKL